MHSYQDGLYSQIYTPFSMFFRHQAPRTLEDLDTLLLAREKLRMKLGNERAQEIEDNPDALYNHEKFREYQAKALRRTTVLSVVVPAVVAYAMTGGKAYTFIKGNRGLWYGAVFASFALLYKPVHYAMGFD